MKHLPLSGRRFAQSGAAPRTFNAEQRTVDVVLSKGSPVVRSYGTERLRIAPDAVDLSRLESAGIPLLDSHTQRGISAAIGRFIRIWFEGETLLGRVQFNKTPQGEAALGMVERGEITSVSVGYIVSRWEITDAKGRVLDPDNDRIPLGADLTFTAVRWQLLEGSLVSVPADAEAVVRSFDGVASPADAARKRMQARQRMLDRTSHLTPTRAARPPLTTANNSVRDEHHVARQIQEQNSMNRISILRDQRDGVAEAMSIALASSILSSRGMTGIEYQGPTDPLGRARFEAHKAQARQYMGRSLVEIAAECIGYQARRGTYLNVVAASTILERAFQSTSDFPAIFSNALNKSLLARYQLVMPTYRQLAVERPFKDFRPHPQVRTGDFPAIQPVQQNGELKVGGSLDASESASVSPFGSVFPISRTMLVNDDLGAIDQILASAGEMVRAFENTEFFKLFNSNPTLATDGTAVFAAGHGNLAGTGAAPSIDTVSAAREALRGMKSLSGNFINVPPAIILTGPANETVADQLVASITPTAVGSVNPYSGKLHSVSDANITDSSWYIAADPARVPCFIYGFLNGASGPRTTVHSPFGTQGVRIALEHDFGVGAIDYRGFYRNPGV
ncbi:hypothetical protein QY049_15735 [Bradyrhizobium sp. WYCCWR 13022]|uniref:phage major capsid protein n=1 Tax=unclassified Bradyrhizobium TaxID=2631580 RepID=UPI00263AFBE1|nr:hypothetical protein [Bradyrhizobium sp. WYCCWR 13022]MDN4984654.1 hypothetical protein [Bradyrhizobium sp. WYCCWR 13022]